MKYPFYKCRFLLLTSVLFFIFSLPAGAQSFFSRLHWTYNGTVNFFASDNGSQADPSQVVPSFGVSAGYHLFKNIRIDLTEDIYFTNYEFNLQRGYPMACNIENRKAFVLGFVTGIQATGIIPIKKFNIRVFGGFAADMRIVVKAFGTNHPDSDAIARQHTDLIRSYFWSSGRMFYAPAGAGVDYPVNDKFFVGIDFRAWIPLYRFWTNENIPKIDGYRFGIMIRITQRKPSVTLPPVNEVNIPYQIPDRNEMPPEIFTQEVLPQENLPQEIYLQPEELPEEYQYEYDLNDFEDTLFTDSADE